MLRPWCTTPVAVSRPALDELRALQPVWHRLYDAIARDGDDPDTQRRDVMRVWMLAHGGLALHRAGALKMRSDASFAEELMRIAFR